jgi:hypothetical protein
MKDMSEIMNIKPLIFHYLNELYGDMKSFGCKYDWLKNNRVIKAPRTISNTTPLTEEIQMTFDLDKFNTNDIINQWFRKQYHIDLFSENKTKILQKKLKRWGK